MARVSKDRDHGSVEFAAVGDIALGDHPLCVGFGAYSKFRHFPSIYPFEKVLRELKGCDLLFGNLECAFTDVALPNSLSGSQMRADAKHVHGLLQTGFNVLNLANNHSMQHGGDAFRYTVNLLQKHDIRVCGVSLEDPTVAMPVILQTRGLLIGFLGYSERPRQYFEHAPLYTEAEIHRMVKEVTAVKSDCDCVVVSLHWGEEFIDRPSPREREWASKLVSAGADLVIGHHPHVLRGIERRGNSYIAYSLGNFVCDMLWDNMLRETMILRCRLSRRGADQLRIIPVYINDTYQPEVLMGDAAEAVSTRIEQLSEKLLKKEPEEDEATYVKEAEKILSMYRSKSHRYFLSRLYRYSPGILMQQIAGYLRRTIERRTSTVRG